MRRLNEVLNKGPFMTNQYFFSTVLREHLDILCGYFHSNRRHRLTWEEHAMYLHALESRWALERYLLRVSDLHHPIAGILICS